MGSCFRPEPSGVGQGKYIVTLGSKLDADLHDNARRCGVSIDEVLRRALVLFFAAVDAKEVKLTTNAGERKVILR